jgi:FkbM family methyltransferase
MSSSVGASGAPALGAYLPTKTSASTLVTPGRTPSNIANDSLEGQNPALVANPQAVMFDLSTREPILTNSAATASTTLRTPFSDRTFDIVGSPDDVSVFGATAKAGGVWEPQIMKLMSRLVEPSDVCLDIGANLGARTLALAQLTPAGTVYAFEPSTMNAGFLTENVRRNDLGNVRLQKLALGAQSSVQSFTHLLGMEGCSFMTPSDPIEEVLMRSWGQDIDRITEDVPVKTLDEWVDENDVHWIDFIKMDVEGSELSVMDGGKRTIERFRPDMIVELNKHALSLYYGIEPQKFFDRLASIYKYIYIIPDNQEEEPYRVTSFAEISPMLDIPGHWWVDMLCIASPLDYREASRRPKIGLGGWLKSKFGKG